ncbi:hypothetical protein EDB86DRAFT_221821 [Lactarius hatsudake]|nr:hypothetical protein EDB86DRAFT_221821 [Lactarius hatsudake]
MSVSSGTTTPASSSSKRLRVSADADGDAAPEWNRRRTAAGTHANAIRASPGDFVLIDAQATHSFERVKHAPEAVVQSLRPQIDDMSTPYRYPPPSVILCQQVYPVDEPVPAHVGSPQKSSPPQGVSLPLGSWAIRIRRIHLCDRFKSPDSQLHTHRLVRNPFFVSLFHFQHMRATCLTVSTSTSSSTFTSLLYSGVLTRWYEFLLVIKADDYEEGPCSPLLRYNDGEQR